MPPLISVIIPFYNSQAYIEKTLGSVLAQTYQNMEIILVNDGSQDRSKEICDEYAALDSRIHIINKENKGTGSARNAGLFAALGDYIGFVDSDDLAEPDMLAYLLRLCCENNADIAQCGCWHQQPNGSFVCCKTTDITVLAHRPKILDTENLKMLGNSVCTKLFRRSILTGIWFDENCPVGEDLKFNLQALQRADTVVFGSETPYRYMYRADSICHDTPDPTRLTSFRKTLEWVLKSFEQHQQIRGFYQDEQFFNDFDICSKIVRFKILWADELKAKLRREIRHGMFHILFSARFSLRCKVKAFLIGYAWNLYRHIVLRINYSA